MVLPFADDDLREEVTEIDEGSLELNEQLIADTLRDVLFDIAGGGHEKESREDLPKETTRVSEDNDSRPA
jgi:hypothetical protein